MQRARETSPRKAEQNKLPFQTVALVLQGGGALGAYQAGVYEGLADAGIEPNWIAGISIGALNTALIAGNPPETRVQKLRQFWETICRPAFSFPPADFMQAIVEQAGPSARKAFGAFEAWRAVVEGQRAFFVPRGLTPWLGGKQGVTQASFYDTAVLKSTLERLVDFDRINEGDMRVSVGAVNVRTGNFSYFDNHNGHGHRALRAEHFMASGALPPAFPAVEIDGEFYWDGGLVSNTPLSHVLAAAPRRNTIAFQVDLWSAIGRLPDNVYDVQERQKDIQYSSRTRAVTTTMAQSQHYRRLLREVLDHVPADVLENDPWCRRAQELACERQYSVIHLIYQDKEWEGLSKDYEFSPITMHEHWKSGLVDIQRTLAHESWLDLPPDGQEFVTHDHHRNRL
ncbi:MAG: patatin-like phospholipase family protein [Burkholderiales bacterium]|jgi:NTE family protein|nr:patatin-like phospholipase family protein [Burkholderiales bacterium]